MANCQSAAHSPQQIMMREGRDRASLKHKSIYQLSQGRDGSTFQAVVLNLLTKLAIRNRGDVYPQGIVKKAHLDAAEEVCLPCN